MRPDRAREAHYDRDTAGMVTGFGLDMAPPPTAWERFELALANAAWKVTLAAGLILILLALGAW